MAKALAGHNKLAMHLIHGQQLNRTGPCQRGLPIDKLTWGEWQRVVRGNPL